MQWKLVKRKSTGISVYLSWKGSSRIILADTFIGGFENYRDAVHFVRECKRAGIRQGENVLVPIDYEEE